MIKATSKSRTKDSTDQHSAPAKPDFNIEFSATRRIKVKSTRHAVICNPIACPTEAYQEKHQAASLSAWLAPAFMNSKQQKNQNQNQIGTLAPVSKGKSNLQQQKNICHNKVEVGNASSILTQTCQFFQAIEFTKVFLCS